jgi:hypothetical protein
VALEVFRAVEYSIDPFATTPIAPLKALWMKAHLGGKRALLLVLWRLLFVLCCTSRTATTLWSSLSILVWCF